MRLLLAAALLLAAPLARAADLSPPSRIDSVVVYPDGAMVTRVVPVELPTGASTVTLTGLPPTVDAGSIRIEGTATAGLAIGAVDVKLVPGEARPTVDPVLEKKLLDLRDERQAEAGRAEALEAKREAIQRYGKAGPERLGTENAPLPVDAWIKAWDSIGAALRVTNEELRLSRVKLRELDGEIRALEAARPRPPAPGQPRRDVVIALEAREALTGTLKVTYRVEGARWQAAYDARLLTGTAQRAPSLELVRRALVAQNTGEDWTDIELSVSTARIARATAAPVVPPLQAGFLEYPMPTVSAAPPRPIPPGAGRLAAPPPASAPMEADLAKRNEVAVEQGATIDAGAFEASFRVPGRVSLARDGTAKTFRIGGRTLEPKLVVKSSPALDQTAYLAVSFTNEEEAALLPGEVLLTRDNAFVGRGRIGLVPPGDDLDLGFGADDRVKVTRIPVRRRETDPSLLGSTKTDQREFLITVTSLHERPMKVTIQDQIPFSEISSLQVEQLSTTTPPTDKITDRRGVLGWTYEMKPKEKREIRVAYRLRYPADRVLTFTPQPVP